ncbi:SRPBCC family protein [Actinomycetospora straminea]|uniref:SRPBCC domain-containing protein n=1 Tax=Actinomycetospora straminea TaxID=663607 RepID=A0ABP9DRG3_9PSEU|nr:SRPBCC domain-containing protein [Actinomycetospora straminea]MDD7936250.1 SRPBCC domain-containing protein [Actinomycetospora straminea]
MTEQDQRTVDLEVTVPGTPEQVWDAIATGPGISSWLHPTRVDEHVGGAFGFDMGGSEEAAHSTPQGTVTAYDAPERFATEAAWSIGTESTTLATEWLVATRDEGTCVVRMVMSGFGSGDDWDDEIDALREGMGVALETLRLYLAHFAGRRPVTVDAAARLGGPAEDAWSRLVAGTGLPEARVGERLTLGGTPELAGTVEALSPGRWHRAAVLLLETPAPGVAALVAAGRDAHASVHLTFFDGPGTDAAAVADRERPRWQAWLATVGSETAGQTR